MDRQTLIQRFTAAVNNGLAQHDDRSSAADAALRAEVAGDAELISQLDELRQNLQQATTSRHFYTRRVQEAGPVLDQCYALLCHVFEPDVLDAKSVFEDCLAAVPAPGKPQNYVLLGRFWSVSGAHQYDADGRLAAYAYDPLTVTQHVAAACSGDYMSLSTASRCGMGAIGQVASRPGMRGQGHGKHIVEAFEAEMRQNAAQRGETLTLLMLEAEAAARQFWVRRGYRWPVDTQYTQPPIDYDPESGEALFPEVPELLMVKLIDTPDAATIERALLVDAVRTLYENWYIPDHVSEAARARIQSVVFGTFFEQFLNSLPPRR